MPFLLHKGISVFSGVNSPGAICLLYRPQRGISRQGFRAWEVEVGLPTMFYYFKREQEVSRCIILIGE